MTRRAILPVLAFACVAALVFPTEAAADFDEARWTERLQANHASADSSIALGDEAARADRARLAVRAYEQAIAAAWDRRMEVCAKLAFQYAWAGDLSRARRAFERARARDPENADLRRGELLVMNWMGDHLAAWKGYEALVYGNAGLEDRAAAWAALAVAQDWAGRRDRALESTQWALHLDRASRDARDLDAKIRAGLRPTAGLYYDGSEDSDHYRLNGLWAEAGVWPHPQLSLSPFVNILGIRHPDAPAIDETWAGLTLSTQPWTRASFWARGAWLTDTPSGVEYTPTTGTAAFSFRPHDRARFGMSVERFAVTSVRVHPEKITGTAFGAFLETRPDWRGLARIAVDRARYDAVRDRWGTRFPANHRWNVTAVASSEVWSPAHLRLGLLGRHLRFDRHLDYGIWTPEKFSAGAATGEWNWGRRDLWSLNGGLELGVARETGGDATLYAGYRVGAYRVLGSVVLEISAGQSEGNVETGSGYDRFYAHAGLRKRF